MMNGYFRPPEGSIDSKALVVRKRYGSFSASLLVQAAVKVGRLCPPPPPVLCPQPNSGYLALLLSTILPPASTLQQQSPPTTLGGARGWHMAHTRHS